MLGWWQEPSEPLGSIGRTTMFLGRQIYHPSPLIDVACIMMTAALVGGLAAYAIVADIRISALSALLDKYPISAYELPPPLDFEIRLADFVTTPSSESRTIEVLRVRSDTIASVFFREAAIAGRLYREPGGWIADDVQMKKTERCISKRQTEDPGRSSSGSPGD